MKILVADDLSKEGIEILRRGEGLAVDVKVGLKPPELKAIVGEYDALVVRSATKVTREILSAATRLKVVGRAGVGVDNVDLEAANQRGIVVMNTPGGNTITVAELTVAMIMAVSRHIPQATTSLKAGKWEKKKFEGHELFNKTLGVIGIGNIGSVVVDRCLGMKMKVVAYDPFISKEAASRLGCELVSLDELFRRSDYVSIHVPLSEQTKNLVNRDALAKMKKGAFLINCARGGIVDEAALAEALASNHLSGAALDVFSAEPVSPESPLLKLDNFICTPHLGASTEEAQLNVAVALAEQMVDYLCHGVIRNAVNVPAVPRDLLEQLGPWLRLAHTLGTLAGQLEPEGVTEIEVRASGGVSQYPIRPLSLQVLKGLLSRVWGESVNEVSAPVLAKERGIRFVEKNLGETEDRTERLAVVVRGAREIRVEGTIFGKSDLRVTRIDQFEIEAVPEGHLIALTSRDVPGVIGRVGTVLGEAGVNIARFHLSREKAKGEAFSLINVDTAPPAKVIDSLRTVPGVSGVKHFSL